MAILCELTIGHHVLGRSAQINDPHTVVIIGAHCEDGVWGGEAFAGGLTDHPEPRMESSKSDLNSAKERENSKIQYEVECAEPLSSCPCATSLSPAEIDRSFRTADSVFPAQLGPARSTNAAKAVRVR
jgi:hypothetical protein